MWIEFPFAPEYLENIHGISAKIDDPVTPPVNEYILRLLKLLEETGAANNTEIRQAFGLKDRRRLRDTYLEPAIQEELIEYTIPDKPTSRLQKYRLTQKGRGVAKATLGRG